MIATLLTLEPLARQPRVLDIDDAVYLRSRFNSAARLARCSDLVICGNEVLADWFSRIASVAILPTAVDTGRYVPQPRRSSGPLVVGWMGSSSNFAELVAIEVALEHVLRENPDAVLRVVADGVPRLTRLPPSQVEFRRWAESTETSDLNSFDIGIMPLRDTAWNRGKCGYKLLTYLACGLPVVASPVGVNERYLRASDALAARSSDDWVCALLHLLADEPARKRMGSRGRRFVDGHLSVSVLAPRFADLLKGVSGCDRSLRLGSH